MARRRKRRWSWGHGRTIGGDGGLVDVILLQFMVTKWPNSRSFDLKFNDEW